MKKGFLIFCSLLTITTSYCQDLMFEIRQDFSKYLSSSWTYYAKNDVSDRYDVVKKVADGLFLIKNSQKYEETVLLPSNDKNRKDIKDLPEATKLYSAGFIFLEGNGKTGFEISTKDNIKDKYATYRCTIDNKGEASMIFVDPSYTEIVVKKTQLKNFKKGDLNVLTVVFDKKNVSFYVNETLIATEKFRGLTFQYTHIRLDGNVSIALTNADIIAFNGGDAAYYKTQIARATDIANANYAAVKSSGKLSNYVVLPEEPSQKIQGDDYSFLFFPSLVKNGKFSFDDRDLDKKRDVLKNIPALSSIDPYEIRVSVDTIHIASSQAYIAKQINWWTESQVPFGKKKTADVLAKSKSRLKMVNEAITINGKKGQAIYVMRDIAEYGRGYNALLVMPTAEKNVFVCLEISAVGENLNDDAKGYLFSPADFALMNMQAKTIFNSFTYAR